MISKDAFCNLTFDFSSAEALIDASPRRPKIRCRTVHVGDEGQPSSFRTNPRLPSTPHLVMIAQIFLLFPRFPVPRLGRTETM